MDEKIWSPIISYFEEHEVAWLGPVLYLIVPAFITVLVTYILGVPKWLYEKIKRRREKINSIRKGQNNPYGLFPYFELATIKKAQKYYIETRGDFQVSQSNIDGDKPPIKIESKNLITSFISSGFHQNSKIERFYLVLAHTGMGKTTFLINLYLRYRKIASKNGLEVRLFPLKRNTEVESEIKELVDNKLDRVTILLLDGLDDDPEAIEDYKARMPVLVSLVKNFRKVIITCRTQFFPKKSDIIKETNIPNLDIDFPGFYEFQLIFLSPFTEKDIDLYLKKRYGGFSIVNRKRKKKAKEIIDKATGLMERPMLLSHLDSFLEDPKVQYKYSHEIYFSLIDRWYFRESGKLKKAERQEFIKKLHSFSEKFALLVFEKWQMERRTFITHFELENFVSDNQISLSIDEIRNQSLLSRDGEGNFSFSHKSILEYFLALKVKAEPSFIKGFINSRGYKDFKGWEIVEKILLESGFLIPEMVIIEGGQFLLGSLDGREDERPPKKVFVDSFELGKYPITYYEWVLVTGELPSFFEGEFDKPVTMVSWNEVQDFISDFSKFYGLKYRLPTEAEWEFAAKGGNLSIHENIFAGSDSLNEVGWFERNSQNQAQRVGQLLPNELGIYDLSGNVFEWCADDYVPNYNNYPPSNSWKGKDFKVVRGGAFDEKKMNCRNTSRHKARKNEVKMTIGFRLARSI